MTYEETLEWLYSQLPVYQRIGKAAYKADLTNTHQLCQLLGNPERTLKCVHVAGTNGKGSVSHMIASVLQETGYKTGLYTSPHLSDFRERIRINGEMISKEYIMNFVSTHREAFLAMELSFFEMTVGLAFSYFKDMKVDIAVLETGMGGRLDSTNVVSPELSVITNIGIDHTQFLGNTLGEIASEKAGIIKAGVPVVVGRKQPETQHVFEETAKQNGSSIIFAQDVTTHDPTTDLAGNYQLENLKTAQVVLSELNKSGWLIKNEHVTAGLNNVIKNTGIKGRWQILSKEPLTICDVGHNRDGIRWVVDQIKKTPHKQLHFVLGMVNDKEIDVILKLLPNNAIYYFCQPNIPRGLSQTVLQESAKALGLFGDCYHGVKQAFNAAQATAKTGDLIFIGGSTFVVAEVV